MTRFASDDRCVCWGYGGLPLPGTARLVVAEGPHRLRVGESIEVVPASDCAGAVEALRDLLAVTDHRTLNEQASGGDDCDCGPCVRARAIAGGR